MSRIKTLGGRGTERTHRRHSSHLEETVWPNLYPIQPLWTSFLLLFVGEYYGVTQVNDQALQQTTQAAADLANQSGSFLYSRLSQLTWKGGSAVAGFLAGLKQG